MNKKDPIIKNKIIESCAIEYLLYGRKLCKNNFLLKPYFPHDLIPSNRQLKEWRIGKEINNIIKSGNLDINNDLGVWTPSFCSGVRNSGIFHKNGRHCFRFNKNAHNEFLKDLINIKLPIKISRLYKNGAINLSGCSFMKLGVNNGVHNYNEYLAGLFTGSRLISVAGEQWLVVFIKDELTLNKVITVLNNYKILYKLGKNGQIFISPFIGALFYGYMPIHSSTRVINVQRAADGAKLALVYWNMVREIGQPVAPTKVHILPFSWSYATYWNRGMLKKTDIRQMGVNMGIIGISDELRELMKEWIKYHS